MPTINQIMEMSFFTLILQAAAILSFGSWR